MSLGYVLQHLLAGGLGNLRHGGVIAGLLLLPAAMAQQLGWPGLIEIDKGWPLLNYSLIGFLFVLFGWIAFPTLRNALLRDQTINAAIANRRAARDWYFSEPERSEYAKPPILIPRKIIEDRVEVEPWMVSNTERGIGLALSGGGHRAALFDLGVLHYLARCGKSRQVSQIASVSGGSMTNGFIARSMDYRRASLEKFERAAAKLAQQIADHGSMFAGFFPQAYLVGFGASIASAILVFVAWQWEFPWVPQVLKSVYTLVALILIVGAIFRGRGWLARRAFEKILFTHDAGPHNRVAIAVALQDFGGEGVAVSLEIKSVVTSCHSNRPSGAMLSLPISVGIAACFEDWRHAVIVRPAAHFERRDKLL